jgi:sigma-B regulation protein RsbU (phosphoserine phosphatase)
MLKGFKSIESRLILWLLGGVTFIFVLTYYLLYRQFVTYTTGNIKREAGLLTVTLGREIDASMATTQGITDQLVASLETTRPRTQQLRAILDNFMNSNSMLNGIGVAYLENAFPRMRRFAPQISRRDSGLFRSDRSKTMDAYWQKDWFTLALRQRSSMWTEPEFEHSEGVLIAHYAVPMLDIESKQPIAVVTADISLESIAKRLQTFMQGRKGFAVIFSGNGSVLVHPNAEHVKNRETIRSLIVKGIHPEFTFIAERLSSGKAGLFSVKESPEADTLWVTSAPLKIAGWSLIYVIPESEFMVEIDRLMQARALGGLLGLFVLSLMVIFLARRISRPLKRLAEISGKVAEGNLNFEIPAYASRDEIGALTLAFARMRDSLRSYIDDLKQTTADKQRMESELNIAAKIQQGMLREGNWRCSEPVPMDLAAHLQPAKMVGGDFYDYIELPDGQFCLVIGDVSDKGVHAALFMARVITLVRSACAFHREPDLILRAMNEDLSQNNDTCMFATVAVVVLDIRFGLLRCASAGHDPVIILHGSGQAEYLEQETGTPVGVDEDAEYPVSKYRMRPGDLLILYTDGVTEATNINQEMFEESRLLSTLQGKKGLNAYEALTIVCERVRKFVREAPAFDDLTMLTLRFGAGQLEPGKHKD